MPEVEITDRLSAPAFSQPALSSKTGRGGGDKEEAALHVKPFIPTARDRSLAGLLAAESQVPKVHVCGSDCEQGECTGEEAAQDPRQGHMHLLPVKVPLASLHCIRALNPREYTERRCE